MKKIVSMLLAITMMSVCMFVSAMQTKVPFDYHIPNLHICAKATNGIVTVEVGENGMIWVSDQEVERQSIKHICYENIYWIEWVEDEFVAFSLNYKLTSKDGYTWNSVLDVNKQEHIKYGVPHDYHAQFSSIGEMPYVAFPFESNYNFFEQQDRVINEIIIYSGKEYLKFVVNSYPNGSELILEIYESQDKENWKYIATIQDPAVIRTLDLSFKSGGILNFNCEVLNTGKEYLVRSTKLDHGSPEYAQELYGITNKFPGYSQLPIYVFDFGFNLIKEIQLDSYTVDMSYINNVYYVTTNENKTYQSKDLENWSVVGQNISVPISNGETTIFTARIPMIEPTKSTDTEYCYAGTILYDQGIPTKYVISEDIELYDTEVYNNFFVGYRDGNMKKRDEMDKGVIDSEQLLDINGEVLNICRKAGDESRHPEISFSKDGIYWATIILPYDTVVNIQEREDGVLLDGGWMQYYIKFSDMEAAVPKSDLRVQLNNRILGFSTPPVMEEDRMLVPMRFLFEQMGAEVNWDENTQTATATVPVSADAQLRTFGAETAKSVTFAIDNTIATVNGSTAEMDVPARLVNDKTMVPLRFLSENLGCTVDWDEATNTAIITTNN